MADVSAPRSSAPWALSAPALLLFVGILIVPLALTAVLSFNAFDGMRGIQPGFTLANYTEVLTDGYYREIFVRTGLMSLGVTALCVLFGVPETLILARMRSPWRGLFLGNLWLYEVESALGKLRLTSANLGEQLPKEGENIGLAWRDEDLRAIPGEPRNG